MPVTLTVNERRFTGWTEAQVVRSLENIAGTFTLSLTESAPGEAELRPIVPGDACELDFDNRKVIDGYVDEISIDYDGQSHSITARGRDSTGDLVDCSVAGEPTSWADASLEEIVRSICGRFGVRVSVGAADTGARFAKFQIEQGESAFEAIDRLCRYRAVQPRSDANGGLILGTPARRRAQVRLQRLRGREDNNILSASGSSSWVSRYSEYTLLGQQAEGGLFQLTADEIAHVEATARDPGITRYRPLVIVGEQSQDADEAKARVDWESNVRAARARTARVSVYGWTEVPNGSLWNPGDLVRVTDDFLALDQELLIVAVTQTLGESGTLTELQLSPPDAYAQRAEPEPSEGGGIQNWWK